MHRTNAKLGTLKSHLQAQQCVTQTDRIMSCVRQEEWKETESAQNKSAAENVVDLVYRKETAQAQLLSFEASNAPLTQIACPTHQKQKLDNNNKDLLRALTP